MRPGIEIVVIREIGTEKIDCRFGSTFPSNLLGLHISRKAFAQEEIVRPGLHPFVERSPDFGAALVLKLVEAPMQRGEFLCYTCDIRGNGI